MRFLLRLVLIVLLVVGGSFLLLGYWAGRDRSAQPSSSAVDTSGPSTTERARERAAELGEKAVEASAKVQGTVTEAGITAKIKAKMALDDSVKARSIDVTTSGSVVTLSGTVNSVTEHDRAVMLARETVGVSQVVDRLGVKK
jgi:hyperosmotically inducible periplasmic protein